MTEEEKKIAGDEDRGVKIEIHGDEEPREETSGTGKAQADEKTEDPKQEQAAGEGNPENGDSSDGTDAVKAADADKAADGGQAADADKAADGGQAADADKAAGPGQDQKDAESGDPKQEQGDGKGGKGFFGFKPRKDKKDEKIEQLTDQVARQLAEFDNYRKRTDREKAAMFDMGKRDTIEKILPVVDNFERGLGDMSQDDGDPFRQGMIKIYRQLMKTLTDMGVKAIEAEGKPFDPNFHNAVMHCEDDSVGENIVVQDLQKGYMINDTVIRHSMVKVAN